MKNPSHPVNENCSTIYVNVGSSNIEPLSVDPNKTGLFGSSLSLNSRILVGDHPDHGFRFKASYRDDPWRMMSEGEPYDYGNDLEYRTKVRNLIHNSHGRRQGNLAFLIKMRNAHLKLLADYLAIFPQIKKTRAVRDLTDMLRQEARNSRIGIRLMNSLVHQYFMKGI